MRSWDTRAGCILGDICRIVGFAEFSDPDSGTLALNVLLVEAIKLICCSQLFARQPLFRAICGAVAHCSTLLSMGGEIEGWLELRECKIVQANNRLHKGCDR